MYRRSAIALLVSLLGLRRFIGPLFRRAAVAEHQQQITAAVQGRTHDRERLTGIVDHFLDRRYRIASREALAQTGTDQQIAFLDIRGVSHMPQFQALGIAGAAGNRPQTVAVDLHWNAVGGIGQQQHTGGVRHQLDHLAHQATGIEHRLAEHHAIALTLVDDDAMGEGIGVHADQFGDFDLFVDQRGGVQQLAQTHVLLGQGSQLLQAPLQQQVLGLEFLVFGDQLGTAAELAGHA